MAFFPIGRPPRGVGHRAVLVVCLVLMGVIASPLSRLESSAEAASPQCHDIYFLSLRGSGEPVVDNEGKPPKRTGTVYTAFSEELQRTGKSSDVEFRQLSRYPAKPVETLIQGLPPVPSVATAPTPIAIALIASWATVATQLILRVNLGKYLAGEIDGETDLISSMTSIRNSCRAMGKTPEIFVAGYSQGAMAAHSVAYRIANEIPSLAPVLTGTALLADPFRVPNSNVLNAGTAPRSINSYGLCHALELLPGSQTCRPGQTPTTAIPIPARFVGSTIEVCNTGDIACDTSKILRDGRLDQALFGASRVHTDCTNTSSYCGPGASAAGRFLAGLSRSKSGGPVPGTGAGGAPTASPSSGPAGTHVDITMAPCPYPLGPNTPITADASLLDSEGKEVGRRGGTIVLKPAAERPTFDLIISAAGYFTPSDAPPGHYSIVTRCYRDTDREISTRTDTAVPFDVTGPAPRYSLTPSEVPAGESVTLAALTPCPGKTNLGQTVDVQPLSADPIPEHQAGLKDFAREQPRMTPTGGWSVKIAVPKGLAPARYFFHVRCRSLGLEGSPTFPTTEYRMEVLTVDPALS